MASFDEEVDEERGGSIPDFLRDPQGTLRRRWKLMLASLLLGLVATGGYTATKKVRYTAQATVLVTNQQIREDLVRTTVQDSVLSRINAMVSAILSLDKLSTLIEKHDPYPDLTGKVAIEEIVSRVRRDVAIGGAHRARPGDYAQVVSVSFTANDPKIAAAFANDLAGLFTVESIRIRTQQASLATSFLRGELDRADEALREQQRKIRKLNEQYRGELPSDLVANIGKLDRLQAQRESLTLQIDEANQRIALLTSQSADGTSLAPDDRLVALRAELRLQLGVHTPEHPQVQSIKRQISELEAVLSEEGSGSAGSARAVLVSGERLELERQKDQLLTIETQLADYDGRVERTPAHQETLIALKEREGVLRENYLDFLRKVQEAELAESLEAAQQGDRVALLDQAFPPSQPDRSRLKFLLMGFAASFGFAVLIGFALEAIDPVIVSGEQLEMLSGTPMLGSVPRLS